MDFPMYDKMLSSNNNNILIIEFLVKPYTWLACPKITFNEIWY